VVEDRGHTREATRNPCFAWPLPERDSAKRSQPAAKFGRVGLLDFICKPSPGL